MPCAEPWPWLHARRAALAKFENQRRRRHRCTTDSGDAAAFAAHLRASSDAADVRKAWRHHSNGCGVARVCRPAREVARRLRRRVRRAQADRVRLRGRQRGLHGAARCDRRPCGGAAAAGPGAAGKRASGQRDGTAGGGPARHSRRERRGHAGLRAAAARARAGRRASAPTAAA